MTHLAFEPLISPALWVTLALLAAGLLGWYAWSRPAAVGRVRWTAILTLSALGIAAVLVILLNPTWLEPIPPPAGKPLLTILVDRSSSMATADEEEGASRYQSAAEIAGRFADELAHRFDVRLRTFTETATPATAEELAALAPEGHQTNLTRAIAESLDDDRPQGQALLLLSDGVHNAPGGVAELLNVARTAKAMAAPIYTKTLGGAGNVRDVEVTLGRPQELAFAGQSVPVKVLVRQRGALTGEVDVVLLEDGKEIARQSAQLTADGTTAVPFEIPRRDHGLYRYEVRVDELANEATPENNSASLMLRVVQDPIRVLLLEGKPYWDGKFLMRTLGADGVVEVDGVVRLREGRLLKRMLRLSRENAEGEGSAEEGSANGGSSTVRRTEETAMLADLKSLWQDGPGLDDYQVIVLGRDAERFLSDEFVERLRLWISRDGGSLVCYRGSPVAQVNQALARLMPVRWAPSRETRFRMQLTDRGSDLNWFGVAAASDEDDVLRKLPSLATVATPQSPKPLAVVLAKSEGNDGPPVVTYQPYGTGRVVTVDGAGMWRWAFLPPEYQSHEAVYGSLWQSLLRWLVSSVGLVPGREMVLRSERTVYHAGETATAMLLTREELLEDQLPTVVLTDDEGREMQSTIPVAYGEEPGVYQVVFGDLPLGHYRASLSGSELDQDDSATTVAFDVRQYLGEQLDVAARGDLMGRISEESEGAVLDGSDSSALLSGFEEHLSRSRRERVRRLTAWDRWWVLAGVLAVWGCSWALRRSGGLV